MKELQSQDLTKKLDLDFGIKEHTQNLDSYDKLKPSDIQEADDVLSARLDEGATTSGEITSVNTIMKEMKAAAIESEIVSDLKETNPHYKEGKGWRTNIPHSIAACELRRRGKDVTALPNESNLPYVKPFSIWKQPKIERLEGNGLADIEKRMEKWGDGARAEIVVNWKGGSGHAFVAERVNGKTIFYDPQTGQKDVSGYFNHVQPGSVRICRIDNLEFTDQIKSYCKNRLDKPRLERLDAEQINKERMKLREIQTDLRACNPNFNKGVKWQINCQRCAPTYELRRRGFEVTAKPLPKPDVLCRRPFSVWRNPDIKNTTGNGLKEIEKNMEKWGDGARAEIVVSWKGGSGHAFVAERVNGKTRFFDPQNPDADASKYFDRVVDGSVRFCRTDNLEFNEEVINKCCKLV